MASGIDLQTTAHPVLGRERDAALGRCCRCGRPALFALASRRRRADRRLVRAAAGTGLRALMALGAAAVLFYSEVFARCGLGELFAGLGLGALPVWGSAWVQGKPPERRRALGGRAGLLHDVQSAPAERVSRRGGGPRRRPAEPRAAARPTRVRPSSTRPPPCPCPLSLAVAVTLGALPPRALAAALPSLLLARPLAWALGRPQEPVPIPALGANVVWNLATNAVLAVALGFAAR